MLRSLFEARLVNQRTRWRDLINGYDPTTIPGVSATTIEQYEAEESKDEGSKTPNLVRIVREGLVKHPHYLDLVGQVGSTPLEFYEDLVRQEKDLLKHHKSGFKQLVKQKSIRMGSDVSFE